MMCMSLSCEEWGWMGVGLLSEGSSFNPILNTCVKQRLEKSSLHCSPLHYKGRAEQDPLAGKFLFFYIKAINYSMFTGFLCLGVSFL